MTAPQVWLITGCSSGFGREIASAALGAGHRVVVTARDLESVRGLVTDYQETSTLVRLDVTDDESVQAAVQSAIDAFGQIDVLVNNAGQGYYVAVEEGDRDEVRQLFETNVLSIAAMIRAVLPWMRARRSGSIVNMGSVGGLVGMPGVGYYSATKFAIEGLSDSLATEVNPLGISVTVVEPGPFQTNFATVAGTPSREIDDYVDTVPGRRDRDVVHRSNAPGDPARAAQAIVDAVASGTPPRHLLLGTFTLEPVRAKLRRVADEIDRWEAVTRSADFASERTFTKEEDAVPTLKERISLIEDRLEIYNVISKYGPAVDSGSLQTAAELWSEGRHLRDPRNRTVRRAQRDRGDAGRRTPPIVDRWRFGPCALAPLRRGRRRRGGGHELRACLCSEAGRFRHLPDDRLPMGIRTQGRRLGVRSPNQRAARRLRGGARTPRARTLTTTTPPASQRQTVADIEQRGRQCSE